jgi:hypothetical protein
MAAKAIRLARSCVEAYRRREPRFRVVFTKSP